MTETTNTIKSVEFTKVQTTPRKASAAQIIHLVLAAGETRRDVLIAAVEASGNGFKKSAIANALALEVKSGNILQNNTTNGSTTNASTYRLDDSTKKLLVKKASESNALATAGAQKLTSKTSAPAKAAPAKKVTPKSPSTVIYITNADGIVIKDGILNRKQGRVFARKLSAKATVTLHDDKQTTVYAKGGQA